MISEGLKIRHPLFADFDAASAIEMPTGMPWAKMTAVSHGKPASMQLGAGHAMNARGVISSLPRLLSFDSFNKVFNSEATTGIRFSGDQTIGANPTLRSAIAYAEPVSSTVATLISKRLVFYGEKSPKAFAG
jgi:hypothetical protein